MKRLVLGLCIFAIFFWICFYIEFYVPKDVVSPTPTITTTAIPTPTHKLVNRSYDREYYGKCQITAYAKTKSYEIGAEGSRLYVGQSCAGWLPFGTKVYIKGVGIRTIQDRTDEYARSRFNNMIIDLYMETVQECVNWGIRERKVYIIKGERK